MLECEATHFEEERFSIRPSQSSVQIARQAIPIFADFARIAVCNSGCVNLPVVIALENKGSPGDRPSDGVDLSVLTKLSV